MIVPVMLLEATVGVWYPKVVPFEANTWPACPIVLRPVPPFIVGRMPVKLIVPVVDNAMLSLPATATVPDWSGSVQVLLAPRFAVVRLPTN